MNYYIYLARIRNTLTDYYYYVRLIIESDKQKVIVLIPPHQNNNKKFFGVRSLKNIFDKLGYHHLLYYSKNIDNLDEEGVYNIVSSVLYMRPKEGYKIDIIRKEKR